MILSKLLKIFFLLFSNDAILTFDQYGISHHINHSAIYHAIIQSKSQLSDTQIYTLTSVPLWRKYISYIDILFHYLWFKRHQTMNFIHFNIKINWYSMKLYATQFIWYRRLFLLFSRYTFFNTIEQIQ